MKQQQKQFWQSKTFWVGALTLAISIAAFLAGEDIIKKYPAVVSGLGVFLGIAQIVLRFLTNTAVRFIGDPK